MLADAMLVATVAVTDLDRAKRFFQEQLGLSPLDETPFAVRYAAGKGTQDPDGNVFGLRQGPVPGVS